MDKVCESCVNDYLKRLIDLESMMSSWKELDNIELLLAIGENLNEENVAYIKVAREKL